AGGEERHYLTLSEMPSHRHSMTGKRASSQSGSLPAFGAYSTGTNRDRYTNFSGNSQPHNVMQPYLVLNVMIKV
ncbi:unnamed protein product, partial [Ectocarpus fasciculatus]